MKFVGIVLVFAASAATLNGAALPQTSRPIESKSAITQMNRPLEPKQVPTTEPFVGVELPLPWMTAAPALVRKADESNDDGSVLGGIVGALVNPDLLLDNDFEPPTTLVRKADESNDDGGVLGVLSEILEDITEDESSQIKRATVPWPVTNVLNLASALFAIEVVGAAESVEQLDTICNNLNTDNMQAFGLNGTMIHTLVCDSYGEDDIPASASDVQIGIKAIADKLWLQQTYIAVAGNYALLCDMFDANQATVMGMDGAGLKELICAQAGNTSSIPTATVEEP